MPESKSEPKVFHLDCSGGGCCPVMLEHEDGSVELEEHGQKVKLNREHIASMIRRLRELGHQG